VNDLTKSRQDDGTDDGSVYLSSQEQVKLRTDLIGPSCLVPSFMYVYILPFFG